MSSQRGNITKGAPKHQNSFAFKHNPGSKKTEKILALPIRGLCEKCVKQIEWRKKYRKYKPLTKPATCNYCHQKSVTAAYHSVCDKCAKERDICAKCCQSKEIILTRDEIIAGKQEQERELELQLEGLRERERRAVLRKIQREREEAEGIVRGEGDDSGGESYDDEDFSDGE